MKIFVAQQADDDADDLSKVHSEAFRPNHSS